MQEEDALHKRNIALIPPEQSVAASRSTATVLDRCTAERPAALEDDFVATPRCSFPGALERLPAASVPSHAHAEAGAGVRRALTDRRAPAAAARPAPPRSPRRWPAESDYREILSYGYWIFLLQIGGLAGASQGDMGARRYKLRLLTGALTTTYVRDAASGSTRGATGIFDAITPRLWLLRALVKPEYGGGPLA